jgi:uncharacterized protein (DUF885 family)
LRYRSNSRRAVAAAVAADAVVAAAAQATRPSKSIVRIVRMVRNVRATRTVNRSNDPNDSNDPNVRQFGIIPSVKIVVLLALTVVCLAGGRIAAQDQAIDDFFIQFAAEWVRGNPDLATSTRYFTGEEQDRLERQLTPASDAYTRQRAALARDGLSRLRGLSRTRMSESQRLSADLLEWQLGTIADGERYQQYDFPIEQNGGANVTLPNALTVTHPMRTPRDAENYVARLRQVRPRMREALDAARARAAQDLIPPRFILQATLAQMREFTRPAPAENPLVTVFAERAAGIEGLRADVREKLKAEAEAIVRSDVYPQWVEVIAFLESLMPRSTDAAGLWRFEEGSAAYAHHLRRFTTTNLTAQEIHQLGLRQVERIETRMDGILRSLGRTQGTVRDRVAQLRKDLGYPTTDEGRRQIMADIDVIVRDAERRSALQFDRRPKAPVIAQPYPRFREANAAASYTAPPLDGSRPGIFQMPLRPDQMTKFGLRTLVYHETIPGHHFQIALAGEDALLPKFRQARVFGTISATVEGWALYAERLAAESGWYDGDPEGLLGQLDDELFRARRLVVDTGLHAMKWTRQQAIDYGIDVSEVERYVANPGQACSYMIGQLKIIELRDKARDVKKEKFSEREFHNVVLSLGAVPLELLERAVDAYIAR